LKLEKSGDIAGSLASVAFSFVCLVTPIAFFSIITKHFREESLQGRAF
jgi:hypothetical protein